MEQPLELIRFDDLDFIFQVTMELNISNLVCARPFERVGGFSSNLQQHFIGTTFRADGLRDLGLIFKVMVGLTTTSFFSQIKPVCTVYQECLLGFLPNLHIHD